MVVYFWVCQAKKAMAPFLALDAQPCYSQKKLAERKVKGWLCKFSCRTVGD